MNTPRKASASVVAVPCTAVPFVGADYFCGAIVPAMTARPGLLTNLMGSL